MKLIRRLFGKKEETQQEIAFDELPVWLESRSEKLFDSIGKHAARLFPLTGKALVEIGKSTDVLEIEKPVGKYHLKMVKITTSNRDNMVKQVRMLIDNISIPESTDLKTIQAFHENAMHNLVVCLDNMMKSHQYAKIVYMDASKQLIADVNALRRLLDELIEPVNEKKELIDAFEKADNTVKEIIQLFSDIEYKEKSITGLKENTAHFENELAKTDHSLTMLRLSESWNQYKKTKDELMILEENTDAIETKINTLVLPLSSGLKRLKKLSESGRYTLNPQAKEEIQKSFSDPKDVNPGFFIEFKNIIESDALNLSPEKKSKMLEQVIPVISSLESLQKNYRVLAADARKKEKELAELDINHEERRMIGEKAALQEKIEISKKELETVNRQLFSYKLTIELKKQELQQAVSIIDARAMVSF